MRKYLFMAISLLPLIAHAYDAKIDGICYNFSDDEATVTYHDKSGNSYSGAIVIPESVTYSGKTFRVTSIGHSAFSSCSSLTAVTIPESVTNIDIGAFYGCSGLASIAIPNRVTTIGNIAFQGCRSLISITLPEGITTIGFGTFLGSSSLTSVIIPDGVTTIGPSAFEGCCSLTSVSISAAVTSIESAAFSGCSSLKSVSIPAEVANIENAAFFGCSSLTDVYCYATEPPSVKTRFEGVFVDGYPFDQGFIQEHTTLHVPAGSLEKYRTALRWSDFRDIVALAGTSVGGISSDVESSDFFDLCGRKLPAKPSRGIYIENGRGKVQAPDRR